MQTLIIDYRNLVKNLSYSIMSGSIACAYPTEPEEIAHRIMKRFFCIRAEYPEARIIIANDKPPYWRHSFLLDWYSKKGLEPVIYKGNRSGASWPFQTDKVSMENLYSQMLEHSANSIGAIVVQDKGLEADDIWGILTQKLDGEIIGFSGDSDWRQCITKEKKIRVYDFTRDIMHYEPIDIRVKYLAGDSGDNIKGCTKFKKNGEPMKNGWGKDGAEKHIEANPDTWHVGIDKDELDKNWMVTTLPCPTWDIDQAEADLLESSVRYEVTDEYWDRYGVTANVRKSLQEKANRDAFISRLRMYLNDKEQ